MAEIGVIVAVDERGAIGRAGTMPWHLPADLAYFKATTVGHPVIMGRRTFASIGRALPGRRNLVLTRDACWHHGDVEAAPDLETALVRVAGEARAFVIGGGEIYALALPLADALYVTHVATVVPDADTWFPPIDPAVWEEREGRDRPADDRNPFALRFSIYRRRTPGSP